MLKIASSPHIHSGRSTAAIMRDVVLALLPAAMVGTIIFGLRALAVIAACCIGSVGFEFLFNLMLKKDQTIGDLSALVTGLLLALNLPVHTPIWQCLIGSLFAVIVVKALFGGLGCNPVNPAMTARVFMLVSFSALAAPAFPKSVDAVSGATPLVSMAQGQTPAIRDLLLGLRGGAIGETCALALLLGLTYLLVRRVITWHIPVAFVGSVYLLSFFFGGMDAMGALVAILSGGLFLGAFFMATDYVTSPSTAAGKLVFGLGAGVLTFLIRKYGIYPEGVSFAILFMNILTPYIDSATKHKIFGTGGKKA
jgi:electron transport complex protein RnfD